MVSISGPRGSKPRAVVSLPPTIFFPVVTAVSVMKRLVYAVESMGCGSNTFFSDAMTIFFAWETSVSVEGKAVGEAPTAVFNQQRSL